MSCGCSNAPATGPLLSGTLDPAFAASNAAAPSADESIFGAFTPGNPKFNFWEAVAVIGFIVLASYVVYKSEKKSD